VYSASSTFEFMSNVTDLVGVYLSSHKYLKYANPNPNPNINSNSTAICITLSLACNARW